jgi:hypothetical protein
MISEEHLSLSKKKTLRPSPEGEVKSNRTLGSFIISCLISDVVLLVCDMWSISRISSWEKPKFVFNLNGGEKMLGTM